MDQPKFGGILRLAEVYCFIMLLRGVWSTLGGLLRLVFRAILGQPESPGMLTRPFTEQDLINYPLFLICLVAFGRIVLRLLRVAELQALNKIRATLSGIFLLFIALGFVALLLPEPTQGVLLPQTETANFKLGIGLFGEALLVLIALLIFSFSDRARQFYQRDVVGPSPGV